MRKPVFPNTVVLFATAAATAAAAALAARAREKLVLAGREHGDPLPAGPPLADAEGVAVGVPDGKG